MALLQPGLDWLEERTGKPVLGTLPYLQGLLLDSEAGSDASWVYVSIHAVQGEARIDWAALQRHKRSFTDPVPDKFEQAYG